MSFIPQQFKVIIHNIKHVAGMCKTFTLQKIDNLVALKTDKIALFFRTEI